MILEDFVMLGTTVPEPTSDGRVFVCSAGVSREMRRLIRIYPLARRGVPHRWDIHRVPVELNPEDSRPESFRVAADRSPGAHDRINERFEAIGAVRPAARADLLAKFAIGSIREANDKTNRFSLAILHPERLELTFEYNPDSPDSPELRLFEVESRPSRGAKRFAYIPRLRFKDTDGTHHLMLRDWGCYELMRKEPGFEDWGSNGKRCEYMAGALRLDASCSLLVGNFNRHRNSWLVISVLRGLRAEPSLLDDLEAAS